MAGVVLALLTVLFGLTFLDVLVTKLASGDWTAYYAMALYASATVGCGLGARRAFRATRVGRPFPGQRSTNCSSN